MSKPNLKIGFLMILSSILLLLFSACFARQNDTVTRSLPAQFDNETGSADSAAISAEISMDSGKYTIIEPGMRGLNSPMTKFTFRYDDDDVIRLTNDYKYLGFMRWPGGTNAGSYNWKTGSVDEEYVLQFFKTEHYKSFSVDKKVTEAKGFERIDHFRSYLQQTGLKAVIDVNVINDTPEQVRDLAVYCRNNNIPVIYWELGNEMSFLTANAGKMAPIFKSAKDYMDRVKIFNDVIKEEYPGAKTVIVLSNDTKHPSYDSDIFNYLNPYWDAMSFHRYGGDGKDVQSAMKNINQWLDTWISKLNTSYVSKLKDKSMPFFIGELGVELGGILAETHYHGLFVAESTLRLAGHPNIKYLGGYRFSGGTLDTAASPQKMLEKAFDQNNTVNVTEYDYKLFSRAVAVDANIADGAIKRSSRIWDTTVSGGIQVKKDSGEIPALYAKAFKGDDGMGYLVIVNKSDTTHNVSLKLDGKPVTGEMTKYFTTSQNPSAENTPSAPDKIKIQSAPTNNPVSIPPYSVTRIEWKASPLPEKPQPSWIVFADAGKGKVDLKWLSIFNAKGYKIKYGSKPGELNNTIDAGSKDAFTIEGLETEKTFYFAVVSYNEAGESLPSNEVQVKLSKPEAPVISDIYPERSGRVGVEWNSVSGVKGYKLKYGTAPGNYSNEIDVGNVCGFMLKGLEDGKTYYFAVSAYNGIGESGNSPETSVIPLSDSPAAPCNLKVDKESDTDITISWTPTYDNVKSYSVYRSNSPYSEYTLIASGITETKFTDSGLDPQKVYYYTVKGVNSQGISHKSSNITRKEEKK